MSDYKVRIVGPGGTVRFEASAPLSEGRAAHYEGFAITHMPTSLWAYKNTDGRHWSVTGKLVSRTPDEALANVGYLDLVRSWVLPDFGNTGGTPPILKLYGYRHVNIDGRQCVLTQYDWNFTDEVDYIWQAGQAMPVIGVITLQLDEVYSAEQITGKVWQIFPSGGGGFIPGESGQSSSFSVDFGGAQAAQFPASLTGVGDFAVPVITPIASALDSQGTVAASVVATLTRNFGSAPRVSPLIAEVTVQLPPVINNPFVSGVGTRLPPPAAALPNTFVSAGAADSFERSGLAPPDIVFD